MKYSIKINLQIQTAHLINPFISDYDNKEDSAISIFRFIEVYNNYRPHSSIGNMTPVGYRMVLEDKKNKEITLQH